MSEPKTSQDILAHIRGKNKYIAHNAVANIPSNPMGPLSELEMEATAHMIANKINNIHKWPKYIKKVLYIIRMKKSGKIASDRITICTLECPNEPIAIRDTLNMIMARLSIIRNANIFHVVHKIPQHILIMIV